MSEIIVDPVQCASRLREQGFARLASIPYAESFDALSKYCNLPIGIAEVIWREARRKTGGRYKAPQQLA